MELKDSKHITISSPLTHFTPYPLRKDIKTPFAHTKKLEQHVKISA